MELLASQTRIIRLFINLFLARFSPSDIDKATRQPLRIGLCGDAEALFDLRDVLVAGTVDRETPFPSLSMHPLPETDPSWRVLEDCHFIVVLLQREHLLGDTLNRIHAVLPPKVTAVWAAVGHVEPWLRYEVNEIARELSISNFLFVEDFTPESARPLLLEMVKASGGFELSMARKMPVLRDLVARRIVQRTARQNLMIAVASALPATIPWIGPIIGLLGVTGEIIILTSNQLKMVLQISSIYDMELNLTERFTEMMPILGAAFGWRMLSRELVGFVPVAGPGIKGCVAFAGTSATGQAAAWYYKHGRHLDAEERNQIFNDAMESARALVGELTSWLPRLRKDERAEFVRSLTDERRALPPWVESDEGDKPIADSQPLPTRRHRFMALEDEVEWTHDEEEARPAEDKEE